MNTTRKAIRSAREATRTATEGLGATPNGEKVFEPPKDRGPGYGPSAPERDPSRIDDPTLAQLGGPYAGQSAPKSGDDGWKKGAGGAVVGLGLFAAKFKGLLVLLLSAKGILISGFSIIASVWFYTLLFGPKFAVAFVMLIAIHEAGHIYFMRSAGLPSGLPYFIPGMGAFVTMKGQPADAYQSSWIAFGGPLFGALGAGACLSYGLFTGERFWFAVAGTGFFMNFFNMMPVPPFDGGRIVEAVSPRLWIAGLVIFFAGIFFFHVTLNPLIFVLGILSLPQIIKAFRGQTDPTFHDLTMRQRATVAVAYFSLAAVMFALYRISYFVPSNQTIIG